MSHGYPDWGAQAPKITTYNLQDMAELAARLGSINTFDRRGDTVFQDDFEDNSAKWGYGLAGSGGSWGLSSESARNGAKCGKLICGDLAGDINFIDRFMGAPILGRHGYEISFSLGASIREVYFLLQIVLAGAWHSAGIVYRPQANTLLYLDSLNGYSDLASGVDLYESANAWHTIKFVIDTSTGKYKRLLIDGAVYDISALSYYRAVVANADQTYITTEAAPNDTSNRYVYFDDFILTQNEP